VCIRDIGVAFFSTLANARANSYPGVAPMLLTWLHRPKSREQSAFAPTRPMGRRRPFRPVFEALEPRLAPATITLIQSIGKAAFTAGGSVLHIPAATGVAAGHGIIIELAVNNGVTPYQTQVTDSAGNVYLHDGTQSGQSMESDMFSSIGIYSIPAGGQITITFSSSVKAAAATAQEFYGLEPNVGTDNLGAANSMGNSSSPSSTVQTFTANDLVLAASAVAADPTAPFGPAANSRALPGAGITAFSSGPAIDMDPGYTIGATGGKNYTTGVQLLFSKIAPWDTSISAYTGDPTTHLKVTASVGSVAPNTGFRVTVVALQGNVPRISTTRAVFISPAPTASLRCLPTTRLPPQTLVFTPSPT
jgi:hypothetical protein